MYLPRDRHGKRVLSFNKIRHESSRFGFTKEPCMNAASDDFECRRRFSPTRLVAGRMFRHPRGAVTAQRDNKQVIDILHDLSQLPMQPLDHLGVESASENAVLQSRAIRLQRLGHLPQSFWIADIVADQVPLFGCHLLPQPQSREQAGASCPFLFQQPNFQLNDPCVGKRLAGMRMLI